jgi:hypothetical protein
MDIGARLRHNGRVQRPRLWLLPLLLAVLVAGGWYFGVRSKAGDRELPVYVEGGQRMAAGEEIYRRGTDSKPFTYPPFAAVPFVPYGMLPAGWQAPLWFALNFMLLLPILVWLHRSAGLGWTGAGPPRRGWLWLCVALLAGRHVFSVFENQSNDMLVFAPAALAIACAGRAERWAGAASGAAAGLATAIKATPLLFAEWFVFGRRFGALAAVVATAALLSLAPDWCWPRSDGRSWAMVWFDVNLRGLAVGGTAAAAGAWDPHSILNQSLSGSLTRLLSQPATTGKFVVPEVVLLDLPAGVLRAVIVLGQLAVVAAIAWGALRARTAVRAAGGGAAAELRRAALGAGSLVLCGMLLLSPQSSKSHFCVLLVPAVFCLDRLLRTRRDGALIGLVVAAAVLGAGRAKGLIGTRAGNLVLGAGAVTWSTMCMLAASLRALRPPGGTP